MGVAFSLHLVPDDIGALAKRAKLAEESGFEQVWVAESHLTCRDHNVALAVAIQNTSTVKIGPGVTNPVLHDDSVAASTIATLDELSGGRVLFGIGSGDTPVYTLGRKMARLATMRTSIHRIRSLVRGEVVEYEEGVNVNIWSKRDIPIYTSAEGPKTLKMSGEIADGVIVGSGVYKETVEWVLRHLNDGIAERQDNLGAMDIIFGAVVSVDRDGHAAREKVRSRVANRAHHNFRMTLDSVPEEYQPEIQNLLDNFDVSNWRHPKHVPLITDYILDRFTITGTPEDCVKRIKEIESFGVKSIMIDPPSQDFDESLELFAKEVMPHCM
ncbi:MAG: LLM class flavin-dependent oxidoreductase [Nitrospinaceae bacterium]|jgi:5,10-methylenetetrahydromethanopterin reductase|nr:LLM class flavin-dependent oxidoreductase [Nitrospinaceae bacterium]MBT3435347.1 LLM class flavin-dependent oxidoreductase [Nitrospinaceae bacterium]MBT4092762.1 LLM class flavin-dependent oxidoreductase [Nitrospinaceae bacterium]MBT4429271.1 LLM class flavin-dependent oxidoreductase [Nitrospinaceae bacterium]MBT5368336.1 LLM class flavin-dependent oxidoreductase [Nitrospinaceae bacterium]